MQFPTPKTLRLISLTLFAIAGFLLFVRVHRIDGGLHVETRYYSIALTSDGF